MKKTFIVLYCLFVNVNVLQAATLVANHSYSLNILADGISCFSFGDCTTGTGALVDNSSYAGGSNPSSSIDGDGLAGVINIMTSSDGAGGVNFTVDSFNVDTYVGTAMGNFNTWAKDLSNMSGSIDSQGNILFNPDGRLAQGQFTYASLGAQEWNIDSHVNVEGVLDNSECIVNQTGSYSIFTSSTSSNLNCSTGNINTALMGTALDINGKAVIVSAGNMGSEWGLFDGTDYTEVFSVHITGGEIIPSAVPVPAAFWLFGSGLLMISVFLSRK